MNTTRCDLHLHSSASVGNDEWYTQLFGCPESYAEPFQQYELCKTRGMTLVTLTDHDTIDGGLTLVDRPDFFLSEEVTATFPDNGCVMHVLAWDITRAHHEGLQARRNDIYQLCEYLNREGIGHGLAHPLLSPNWKLDAETFEKLLLLFPTFEGINGLTDRRIEPDLATMLDRLNPEIIQALATKHGLPAYGCTPHRKALTAGSDDHVHRQCGSVYVEIDEPRLSPSALVASCMGGMAQLRGKQAHVHTMAMCAKHTTYHYFKQRQAGRSDYGNPFVELIDTIAGRPVADGVAGGFVASLLKGAECTALEPGDQFDLLRIPADPSDEEDTRIVEGATLLSNKVVERALKGLVDGVQEFDLYRIFGALRDLAASLATTVPMFFAADHFGKQEQQVRRVFDSWTAFSLPPRRERLAVFCDSLEQVHGVSTWCHRFIDQARVAGREVLIPHCAEEPALPEDSRQSGFYRIAALTSFALPLYPSIRIYLPSPVDMLSWVWREKISHVELATPGPMGLMGLLLAKVLRLPTTASYHTEVPALIRSLGGNVMMETAARRYLSWFYARVDRVFAFSSGSRDALIAMGVDAAKVTVMPIAVDPTHFAPTNRSSSVFELLNVDVGERPVILSVGRISPEKNLPLVIEAVERLQDRTPRPVLVVVGDGPDREALEARYRHLEFVRFVGLQRGATLGKLYASASAFVFASRIDTLGLVNMEAMASGVPVLVPADACIAELVTNGISAECYEFGAAGLATKLARLLDDPLHASRLGVAGRRAMVERWQQTGFSQIWKSFTEEA